MSFSRALARRMGGLTPHKRSTPRRSNIPFEARYVRRSAGLQVRMRPDEHWGELQVGPDATRLIAMSLDAARVLLGLTHFTPVADVGVSQRVIEGWTQSGLLTYADHDPEVSLQGVQNVKNPGRRRSAWPTALFDDGRTVRPYPFMPRRPDLEGGHFCGLRFACLERGHEVLGVSIAGSEKTAMSLSTLWTALGESAHLPQDSTSTKLLEILDLCTLLETAPEAASWPADSITWLGHAGVLLDVDGTRLMIDPLFFSSSEPSAPYVDSPPDPRALPPPDAIAITHADNDHLNPNTLVQLRRETRLIIPKGLKTPKPWQVDMRLLLSQLGFHRLTELAPEESTTVGAMTVQALPFEGEDWNLELAQLTYRVQTPDLGLYFSADTLAFPIEELAKDPPDLAFLGISGCAEPMLSPAGLGYGNFYADWVAPEQRQEWVQHCAGPKEAAVAATKMKARHAFGYAAGGASFIRTEYADRGTHAEFAARLQDELTTAVDFAPGVPVPLSRFARVRD